MKAGEFDKGTTQMMEHDGMTPSLTGCTLSSTVKSHIVMRYGKHSPTSVGVLVLWPLCFLRCSPLSATMNDLSRPPVLFPHPMNSEHDRSPLS